jgi:hypothetical protein
MSACVVVGPHQRVLEAQAVPYDGHLVHFQQGPADLLVGINNYHWNLNLTYKGAADSLQDFKRRASDILWSPLTTGNFDRWKRERMTYTISQDPAVGRWHFSWFFRGGGTVTPIVATLTDPQGWARAGIAVEQTQNRNAALCEIEIVQTIAGFPQAAGLYRWTGNSRPEVLLVARYLNDPNFGRHLINHEAGHMLIRAYDMIPERGFPWYSGIMDYQGIEGVPIDREIEDAKRWLVGQGVLH